MQGIRLHGNRPWWNPRDVKGKKQRSFGQTLYKSWLKKLLLLILGQPPRESLTFRESIARDTTPPSYRGAEQATYRESMTAQEREY